MTGLDVLKDMLEKIGAPLLEAAGQGDGAATLDQVIAVIRDVLQHKVKTRLLNRDVSFQTSVSFQTF